MKPEIRQKELFIKLANAPEFVKLVEKTGKRVDESPIAGEDFDELIDVFCLNIVEHLNDSLYDDEELFECIQNSIADYMWWFRDMRPDDFIEFLVENLEWLKENSLYSKEKSNENYSRVN